MAMEKLTKDMNIIANLDDEPNDVGGLTAAELKAKFDEGGLALKAYLNDVLIPALEALGVEQAVLAPEGAGFKYLRLDSNQVLEFSDDGETWRTTASQIVDGEGNELGYGAYVSAEDRARWNAKQPAIPGTAGQVPVFGEDGSLRGADQVRPETAALYGKGAGASVDEVLAILSKAILNTDDGYTDVNGTTLPQVKIDTGSYVGVGGKGVDKPNTLTFPFPPKLVIVVEADGLKQVGALIFVRDATKYYTTDSSYETITWSDTGISWYGNFSAGQQYNQSGMRYVYIAFG